MKEINETIKITAKFPLTYLEIKPAPALVTLELVHGAEDVA